MALHPFMFQKKTERSGDGNIKKLRYIKPALREPACGRQGGFKLLTPPFSGQPIMNVGIWNKKAF
jgi:hypothetical protein